MKSVRERAGCLAHARRKFFDASILFPAAPQPLEMIREIYVVEREAKELGIAGTPAHRTLRLERSAPVMEGLGAWLGDQAPRRLPQGPTGKAIRYAIDNWKELTLFLSDPRIPPDNNRSEAALRVAALGRKNFLFVANEAYGQH